MKRVLLFGTFDTIHPGHHAILREARKYGEVHVCLALDETIQKTKGRPPVHSLNERQKKLEAFGVAVHPGSGGDKLTVFKELLPDTVLLGYDQQLFVPELKTYIRVHKLGTKIIELDPFHPELFKSKILRRVSEDADSSFLLIDKPSGQPSFKTIVDLRKITGIRQIGFAGTLDPIASGLLVCGIAGATQLLDWWHVFPKTYEATAQLGIETDTYDSEGTVLSTSKILSTKGQLEKTLKKFTGEIEQKAPVFSAKKVQGKKMYELAREGKKVTPRKYRVSIKSIELLSYVHPNLQFRVTCSAGTYIRSLIHDMGETLGSGAAMFALRRLSIGSFSVDNAITFDALRESDWRQHTLTIDTLQESMMEYLFP